MQAVFPLAGALLVFLEVVGSLSERTKRFLPLGGSHIAQVAVVFGLAFVVYEVGTVLSQ
jgi:hypothetical protein